MKSIFLLSKFADKGRRFKTLEVYSTDFAMNGTANWICFSSHYILLCHFELNAWVFLVELFSLLIVGNN